MIHKTYFPNFAQSTLEHFEGSRPESCILGMIYSRDTPFWSGTLEFCTSGLFVVFWGGFLLLLLLGFVVVVVVVVVILSRTSKIC